MAKETTEAIDEALQSDADCADNFSDELTDLQREARAKLKTRVRELTDAAGDEPGAFSARPTTKELGNGREPEDPAIIYSSNKAPVGPPWHYDITPDEAAAKQQKKEQRALKRQKMKKNALDKTPQKLKNPSGLQVRFRTGLVYTLVTIACVFAGNIPTMIYLMVVAGICAGEFYYMLRSDSKLPNEMLGIAGAVLFIPAVYFGGLAGGMLVALVLLIALLIWYVFWLRARIQDVSVSFLGAAYTGLLLSGLMIIRASVEPPWGGLVLFLLFLSVWANDAFAYFVGSKIGKHKLAPRTSPKKSWEGFLAGLVGSMLVWVVMSFVPSVNLDIPTALLFGLICGLLEVLGDLAESRIKRNSGFKDSGTIMPGHGGLLDRCDSLFLASVSAAFLLILGGCIPYDVF
ncbi:phosphatidate cytidylyltransferase [Adlercreutzia sp. ZJ304]|uniref:phosphatidate cytidylyltransferase n=1 Tax=Adlercreutzia sp. ZJ304 TaxID=2709791 RepID=UPI001F14D947|nr:phosphatidate cytidylyltransferase [Adlercreutzia sp. ZJ304]